MSDAKELADLTRRLRRAERGLIGCIGLLVLLAGIAARAHLAPIAELRLRNPDGDKELVLQSDTIRLSTTDAEGGMVKTVIAPGALHHEQTSHDMTRRIVEVSLFEVDVIDYVNQRRAVLSPATIGLQAGIESGPGAQPAWTAMRPGGFSVTDTHGRSRLRLGLLGDTSPKYGLGLFTAGGKEYWRTPENRGRR